ncbi:hypothetical protein ACF0H5_002702 [Mactra antiquata]
MALGLLGAHSIRAHIEKQKQLFFRILCRTSPGDICSQLFTHRLFQGLNNSPRLLGFIPDILSILNTYDLGTYLDQFLLTGLFPPKFAWKKICTCVIHNREETMWRDRLDLCSDFRLFRGCHWQLREYPLWTIARTNPGCLSSVKFLTSVCCRRASEENDTCHRCPQPRSIDVEHMLFHCPTTSTKISIAKFFDDIGALSVPLLTLLRGCSKDDMLAYMLGKIDSNFCECLDVDLFPNYLSLCYALIRSLPYDI